MPSTTSKNLGQVAAVIVATTAPTNTNVIWIDTSGNTAVKKTYDPISQTWIPLTQTATVAGDNWGTQVVIVDTTLAGTGITGSPLKIAQQGATSGQILKWNGSSWLPANASAGGLTSVTHDPSLVGDGSTGAPLGIIPGQANGQILIWNGTTWAPSAPNLNGLVQPGMILMWSGTIATIPAGWALCNGTGQLSNAMPIPDLGKMFIVGYSNTDPDYTAIGPGGGVKFNNLIAAQNGPHGHGVNDPGHTHNVVQGTDFKGGTNTITPVISTGSIAGNFTTVTSVSQTGITLSNSGTGANIENRPPYYVLAYIIKL